MTETIRFSQLAEEDIKFGAGSFEVQLADGKVVTLSEANLGRILAEVVGLKGYTKAGLPTAGTAGRLARVTDDVRGIWMDQGSQWFPTNQQRIYAEEFGVVVGDLAANESVNNTALTNAILAAVSTGSTEKTLILPTGIIRYSDELLISNPTGNYVRIEGYGGVFESSVSGDPPIGGTILKYTGTGIAMTIQSNYLKMGNFILLGSASAVGGILLGNAPTGNTAQFNTYFYHMAVVNFLATNAYGLRANGSNLITGPVFDRVSFQSNYDGVIIESSPTIGHTTFHFKECMFQTNTRYGLFIKGGTDLRFTSAQFQNNGNSAIFADSSIASVAGLTLISPYFESNNKTTSGHTVDLRGASETSLLRSVSIFHPTMGTGDNTTGEIRIQNTEDVEVISPRTDTELNFRVTRAERNPGFKILPYYDQRFQAGMIIGQLVTLYGTQAEAVWSFHQQLGDGTPVPDWANTQDAVLSTAVNAAFSPRRNGGPAALYFNATRSWSALDNPAFSFGNGVTDSVFSLVTLVHLDPIVSAQEFISKRSTNNKEWEFFATGLGLLTFTLWDESAGANLGRQWSAALVGSQWYVLIATYSGSGTEAGMKIYVDGVRRDDTSTSAGAYVAMENLTAPVANYIDSSVQILDGDQSFAAIFSREFSAAEVIGVTAMLRGYAGTL